MGGRRQEARKWLEKNPRGLIGVNYYDHEESKALIEQLYNSGVCMIEVVVDEGKEDVDTIIVRLPTDPNDLIEFILRHRRTGDDWSMNKEKTELEIWWD